MSPDDSDRPTVAIACQGGGSHTAFTAGVLDRLLAEEEVGFEVVELAGTSGGAICAFATWFGLASDDADGRAKARRLLRRIWDDIAATDPADALANLAGVGTARAQSMGLGVPSVSPYVLPAATGARARLRRTLEDAVDPEELAAVVGRDDPLPPRLDVGAVDVQRGTFRTFTERDVTHDAVLASVAVPTLFRAAPVTDPDGTDRYYWDGLFSQNPPLGDLFGDAAGRRDRADELWVIQINPQREDGIPTRLDAIADRRNELGGNLSVNQELRFVRQLNQWHAEGELSSVYRPLEVKTINLEESAVSSGGALGYETKLDRSPAFLDRLWDHGREQAARFLDAERTRRRVRAMVTERWSTDDPVTDRAYTVSLPTNLAELRAYLDGDAVVAPASTSAEGLAEFTASVRAAIPDLTVGIEELVAERETVAVRWLATGTHTGTLATVEPTGASISLPGMSVYHLEDGRPVRAWVLSEQWGLLRQVDAVDPPAPLSTTARVAPTPVVTQLSAPAENETVARREVEAVWNAGRREALDTLVGPNVAVHLDDGTDVAGRDQYWKYVQRYHDAFPDLSVSVAETVSEGDKVVLRERVTGTHEGRFLGRDPTGERIDVARMTIHHLDDGRIVETGVVEDTVRLLHQLGVPPAAG